MADIFEQYQAFTGSLPGQSVVAPNIESGARLPEVASLENHGQQRRDCLIELRSRQSPCTDCFDKLASKIVPAARHLQVQSGAYACHAIVNGSPVRNHKALEAPFFSQNVLQ